MSYQFGTKNDLPVFWMAPKLNVPHIRLEDVNSLLHALSNNDSTRAVELIEEGRIDINECEGAALFLAETYRLAPSISKKLIEKGIVFKNEARFMTLLYAAMRHRDYARLDLLLAYGDKNNLLMKKNADVFFILAAKNLNAAFYQKLIEMGFTLSANKTHDVIKVMYGNVAMWRDYIKEDKSQAEQKNLLEGILKMYPLIEENNKNNLFFIRQEDWELLTPDFLSTLVGDYLKSGLPMALEELIKYGAVMTRYEAIEVVKMICGAQKNPGIYENLLRMALGIIDPPELTLYEDLGRCPVFFLESLKAEQGAVYARHYLQNGLMNSYAAFEKVADKLGLCLDEIDKAVLRLFFSHEEGEEFSAKALDVVGDHMLNPWVWEILSSKFYNKGYEEFFTTYGERIKQRRENATEATVENACLYIMMDRWNEVFEKKLLVKELMTEPFMLDVMRYRNGERLSLIWDDRLWRGDLACLKNFYERLSPEEQTAQEAGFTRLYQRYIVREAQQTARPFRIKR